ncbi:assimilatory sulfite reductase (NADPH) flavoprotein subunit [Paraglaciecola polaris]|uniref:Sulfite reductase [NADPH] flavoprotein alpha-component n=1 Tax=Paraglaciecola polaris LMG 21857 TaxID=1129793 RepID=K7AHW2_9ALTE|nr:assimilatory sulfite reductase (NADPH) flavoprotein subunit [Paraglaciecola polaris]GAC34815.1 sulfite reductase (NADPH) flavoprotein alpha-component [Paraglaciecola polaris LMG 21857]
MSSNTQKNLGSTTALSDTQWAQLNQLTPSLTPAQMGWLSGYLAGLAQTQVTATLPQANGPAAEASSPEKFITLLYGSQTGNAKALAQGYKAKLDAAGIAAKLVNMADYKVKQLKNESHIVVIVSTHGEGDAPDDAVELHDFLASKKAPKLPNLKFSVLGLGDSSYEFFCQTAKDFDKKLAELGATRIVNRVDCDVDYDEASATWAQQVLDKVQDELKAKSNSHVVAMPHIGKPTLSVAAAQYSKKNPFTASLLASQKITGRDSVKDIRHVEISLEESGIQYRPGDALGVWFKNDPSMVDELLALLEIDGASEVSVAGDTLSAREALIEKRELTQSYPSFASAYAQLANNPELNALIEDKAGLRAFLGERQIIDVVRQYPVKTDAQSLIDMLRGMTPRLYSIASSQNEVEDEVHLTVALVEYDAHGHAHQGGASSYLTKRLEEGAEIQVFVEKNDNFRLPESPETPVIMVGPGTGIAPFRAFMQEREAQETDGKNWLFFGNPNFTQDFLYQTEWQRFVKDGVLDKVSLAFSRDQEDKIYVQHRLLEQGAEVFEWLEQGAHFYVCGDANHMAKDVHAALVEIVQKHGAKSAEAAEEYLTALRRAKRYQKDVY